MKTIKDINREEWMKTMLLTFKGVHDDLTAVRLANQFCDELEKARVECKSNAEFLSRFFKNFGEKLGIDEVEIKRQQTFFTRMLLEKGGRGRD